MGGDAGNLDRDASGFLLTLARVAGVFVFVPMPGIGGVVNPARVMLAFSITIALYPLWPRITTYPNVGTAGDVAAGGSRAGHRHRRRGLISREAFPWAR